MTDVSSRLNAEDGDRTPGAQRVLRPLPPPQVPSRKAPSSGGKLAAASGGAFTLPPLNPPPRRDLPSVAPVSESSATTAVNQLAGLIAARAPKSAPPSMSDAPTSSRSPKSSAGKAGAAKASTPKPGAPQSGAPESGVRASEDSLSFDDSEGIDLEESVDLEEDSTDDSVVSGPPTLQTPMALDWTDDEDATLVREERSRDDSSVDDTGDSLDVTGQAKVVIAGAVSGAVSGRLDELPEATPSDEVATVPTPDVVMYTRRSPGSSAPRLAPPVSVAPQSAPSWLSSPPVRRGRPIHPPPRPAHDRPVTASRPAPSRPAPSRPAPSPPGAPSFAPPAPKPPPKRLAAPSASELRTPISAGRTVPKELVMPAKAPPSFPAPAKLPPPGPSSALATPPPSRPALGSVPHRTVPHRAVPHRTMPRIAPPPPAPARLPAAPPIPRPLPLPSASRPGLEEEPSARESFDSLPEMPPPAPAPSREAPTALSLNRQALNRQAMGVPAYSAKLPSLPPLEAPARVDTGRGSGSIWILLGGFAAAACLVIAALALMPRDGQLYVDVRDQSGNAIPLAEVFIDGQKQCDASPCVVRKIEAGHKLVQVLAPGHANQAPVTANIESGEENRLVVTLASATGSLSAKSAQPNVRVFVDGDDRGTLPVELDDLTPGAHELRFDAGPLYTAEKRSIDVVAGEAVDVGEVRLDIAKAIVNVEVDAKATRVLFSRAGERAKVLTGPFPRAVELDPSATWKLVAVRAGYDDVEANVDFADGVAEKTVRLAWREPATTDAPTRVSAADLPTTTPSSSVASAPVVASTTPAAAPADDDGAKSSEVAAEMGTLNVNSIPVSKVLVDGAPMGETPRLDISLAPGTHTVTFIHPELGRKSVSVQIKPGVLTRAAVKLRD